jgi:hypothetical protein
MPIPNLTDETPINQYVASSAQTEFAFTFYFFAESDIKVYVDDILKTITTDYVVRKNDGGVIGSADLPMDGGKIVFNVGLTAGAKVSINREVPIDRSTQFSTGGSFKADVLNSELTRILTVAQQLKRDISRSFRLAPSDAEGGSLQLPTDRANNILAFDGSSNLTLIKLADIDKANVSPFIATLLNDADAAEARTTLSVQPLAANLTNFSNLTPAANKALIINGSGEMAFQDRLASTTNQGVSYLNNPITIANNATDANNDINFSAGNAPLDDGSGQFLLSSTLVKRLDASWSAGTNQGGLFSGTKANSTKYYLFAITNGTIIDAGFDISPTGANIPAGYKGSYRGMVLTDASGNIIPFTLTGQYMSYVTEITDYTPTTPTSAVYQTYSLSCPSKPNILAYIRMTMVYTGTGVVSQDFNYRNTGQLGGNYFGGGAINGYQAQNPTGFVPLNSSAQVDLAFTYNAPSSNFAILTKGYFDFNIKL